MLTSFNGHINKFISFFRVDIFLLSRVIYRNVNISIIIYVSLLLQSLIWLVVLCHCVHERWLYESPSDSAIRLIEKREKSFRLLTSRFSSFWERKKKKKKKKKKKRDREKWKREWENEGGKRETDERERERKHTNTIAFCMSPIRKKKKNQKEKKKNYHVPRKKARSFHPARFDHRNANCFHMCFHIWNFFSFFFFFFFFFFLSFPFCLRQNEIVQNKKFILNPRNDAIITIIVARAFSFSLFLSSLRSGFSIHISILRYDIIVKNYRHDEKSGNSWTFNAHVKNSDNYPCNGPLLHQLDYLGFERSRIYISRYYTIEYLPMIFVARKYSRAIDSTISTSLY